MKWKTKISQHKDGALFVRGVPLVELIATSSFAQALYFILKGTMPQKGEAEMLDAMLVACIEHGVEVPSAFTPRVVASTGNSINTALASGLLAIGDHHGGAIENAMQVIGSSQEAKTIVATALAQKERLAGYGHKIYKDTDPRTQALFVRAAQVKLDDTFIKKALLIEGELKTQSGKSLPLNVDGALAALLLTMGFDARLGKAFFAMGRMPGMMAHILEELDTEKPYRRFEESDVEYDGK